MVFKDFAQYLQQLEQTASRNEMTEILASLFKKASRAEIDKICYLVTGRLAPKFAGIEFQMAEKMMLRVIAEAYGWREAEVRAEFKKKGDLGDIVETGFKPVCTGNLPVCTGNLPVCTGNLPVCTGNLEVGVVYNKLLAVASESGAGSVEKKIRGMAELLRQLDGLSAKYAARIPVNKLRLGFSDMTILDSLSWMIKGDKSLRGQLERAFNVSADIGKIARVFKAAGMAGLKKIKAEPGIPIRAAQAERLPSAAKIMEKLGECAVEPKFDGLRVQIHIIQDRTNRTNRTNRTDRTERRVEIFSRNLDNITNMFPDIVRAAAGLEVDSAILDGEAIGVEAKTGKFLAFQETVQRKRKYGVVKMAKEIPIKVFLFDCLYYNGRSLLQEPFAERRETLVNNIYNSYKSYNNDKIIDLIPQKIVKTPAELMKEFKAGLEAGFEGVMVKKLQSIYQAGARNFNWVKFKHLGKGMLVDTFDCLVLGLYRGKGRRAGFGVGAFLAGVNEDKTRTNRMYKTISKIGTGLSDEQWKQLKNKSEKLKVKVKPLEYEVDKNLAPDVWLRPGLVVEIAADEVTRSPIHTAGREMAPSKSGTAKVVEIAGYALRFPRLVRFREDKGPEEVTSLGEVMRIAGE